MIANDHTDFLGIVYLANLVQTLTLYENYISTTSNNSAFSNRK